MALRGLTALAFLVVTSSSHASHAGHVITTSQCATYHIFQGHCYMPMTELFGDATFTFAREQCAKYGGRLATVGSAEVNEFIRQVMEGDHLKAAFLGLEDGRKEGLFTWVSGRPLEADAYINWESAAGTPPGNDVDHNCVTVDVYSGQWHSADCDQRQHFICEFGDAALKTEYRRQTESAGRMHLRKKREVEANTISAVSTPIIYGCSLHQMECDYAATCVDLPDNSWECVCDDSYQGDGLINGTGCQGTPCLPGFIENDMDCFMVFPNDTLPYEDAALVCGDHGAHLATIFAEDDEFLFSLAAAYEYYDTFWIGYTDSLWHGIFSWEDGSFSMHDNWGPQEPSGDRHCVYLEISVESEFQFYTANCTDEHYFICSMPRVPEPCPRGYTQMDNDTCVIEVPIDEDFYEAYMVCLVHGGDLVSVSTQEQLDALLDTSYAYDTKYWLGLDDGYFNELDGVFYWTDGTLSDMTAVGTPFEGNKTCVIMDSNSGDYSLVSCDEAYEFICEVPVGGFKTCPPGSMPFGDKCYKIKVDTTVPSYEGWEVCTKMGGDLVSIESEAEQQFLADYLVQRDAQSDYWIGLKEATPDGNYSWTDGSESEYRNWGLDQPNDTEPYNCVRMRMAEAYAWDDISCDISLPFLCEYYNTPCRTRADCHVDGECYMGQCRCQSGFLGDGKDVCIDVDECVIFNPCDPQATCTNTIGSFNCTCDPGYVGSGIECINERWCLEDYNCHMYGFCDQTVQLCECVPGYVGNGKDVCNNIDECSLGMANCSSDAFCTDTVGSYRCTCNDGFVGDGFACQDIPQSCYNVLLKDPAAESGVYQVDPDGPGGVAPFEVECDLDGIGITIIPPIPGSSITITDRPDYELEIDYEYGTLEEIYALINVSGFCYQELQFSCSGGANLIGASYWEDGKGLQHNHWAGANTDNYCACGMIGACLNPMSTCNCDGSMTSGVDYGKVTDSSQLPITLLGFTGVGAGATGTFKVGPLRCGPIQIEIPKDCDEFKFVYDFKSFNTPALIDVDGAEGDEDGNLPPFLAFCNVEEYPPLGITEIPGDNGLGGYGPPFPGLPPDVGQGPIGPPGGPVTPQDPGTFIIFYPIQIEIILKLIKVSTFCSQVVEYQCENSRLIANGAFYGYVSRHNGSQLNYWPGGMQQEHMCGCGITHSCDDPHVSCNCDITDGVPRTDFGMVTDKEDLPVGSITVTDIGDSKRANYTVGWLKCGEAGFGIESSCQNYQYKGRTQSYTYLVDPDGPIYPDKPYERDYGEENKFGFDGIPASYFDVNLDPFPVVCDFLPDEDYAITIVPDYGNITYPNTDPEQILKLIDRSAYCTQTISYSCVNSAIHSPDEDAYWVSRWMTGPDGQKYYFDGSEGTNCGCGSNGTCVDDLTCNCDLKDGVQRFDHGVLTRKEDLPITGVFVPDNDDPGASGNISVGPLMCYEVFPTCYHLKQDYIRVFGDPELMNGDYTIDPDEALGVNPFIARCEFPLKTQIYPNANGSVAIDGDKLPDPGIFERPNASCYAIGYPITDEQILALIEVSGYCMQYARYQCKHSPLSTHAHLVSRDGYPLPGWAGNNNGTECGCGEVDRCDGGPDLACNCDLDDDVLRKDHGNVIHKEHLPLSEVCIGYSQSNGSRYASYYVAELKCGPYQFEILRDCQQRRNQRNLATEAWIVDPDGPWQSDPFVAWCEMTERPAVGVTVITHNSTGCVNLTNAETEVTLTYNGVTEDQLDALVELSAYCKQEMEYRCHHAELSLEGDYGWYTYPDQPVMPYWAGNTGGTGCLGGECNCNSFDGNWTSDGGWLSDKYSLPVRQVELNAVSHNDSARCLEVEALRCYRVRRNCHEIYLYDERANPLGNNRYAIDPDSVEGVPIFEVLCDYSTNQSMGISIVETIEDYRNYVTKNISYLNSTYEQIHELIDTSFFCSQELDYACQRIPLINDLDPEYSYFMSYDGTRSTNWAGADRSDVTGCACSLLDMCPVNHNCRCDVLTNHTVFEGGLVTNLQKLPVTQVVFGGAGVNQYGYYSLGPVRCAPWPFDLPKDCEEVRASGGQTGEYLIWPAVQLPPFLVFCDMEMVPGSGVTIIVPDTPAKTPVDSTVDIVYKEASLDQVLELVKISLHCYQPVKLDCYATQYLGVDSVNNGWYGNNGQNLHYLGYATPSLRQCSCGEDQKCGGHDGKANMVARKCNCDNMDYQPRADAGTFSTKSHLPIRSFYFNVDHFLPASNSSSQLTVGKLYCANTPFDVDECALGFHDCHKWADCTNVVDKYQCTCREGYRGLGVMDVWANGRECYDDNECNLGYCPVTSSCVNTDGSFICDCNDGYRQMAPTQCVDIDECAEATDDCHIHADCYNTQGSFVCKCQDGYKGTGQYCEPVGQCTCFGDPHCLSYDRHWTHYQGACSYILSRDECTDNFPSGDPSWQIIEKSWRVYMAESTEGMDVSWTKEIYVLMYGHNITMGQAKRIYFNGVRVNLPSNPDYTNHPDLRLQYYGDYIQLKSDLPFMVFFDGDTMVVVEVQKGQGNQTCGLCGDYNGDPSNDWVVGGACPEKNPGHVTTSLNVFGDSWLYMGANATECDDHTCEDKEDEWCSEQDYLEAIYYCGVALDPEGVFKECFLNMPLEEIAMWNGSCIIDSCATGNEIEIGLCSVMKALVARCEHAFNVDIENWRDSGVCEVQCGEGQVFSPCANPCQPSCNASDSSSSESCTAYACMEMCVCKSGLVLDGSGRCVPPDQCGCPMDGNYFSVGDRVVSADCSLQCTCPAPLSAMSCVPITCHDDATCFNDDGIIDCYCNEGYQGDGQFCEDIDECTDGVYPCDAHADCANTIGSFECTCQDGYRGDGFECHDIDECLETADNCTMYADCLNTAGSYECPCQIGFTQSAEDPDECEDVDECTSNRNQCDRQTTDCDNTIGSYVCMCQDGYQPLDDLRCEDIDECQDAGLNDCHDLATCYNSLGGFSCRCNDGFTGDGVNNCTDIDECVSPDYNECDTLAECTNTIGAYNCTCIPGYVGDGFDCEDLNECREWTKDDQGCTWNIHGGICVNTPGSYFCRCRKGYIGDGLQDGEGCTDIEECTTVEPPVCGANANCTNTVGWYNCECVSDEYFSPTDNGKNCEEKPQCTDPEIVCGETEVCKEGPHGAYCTCPDGMTYDDQMLCEDDDQCTTDPGLCSADHMFCKELPVLYLCVCDEGYSLSEDLLRCEDFDECENSTIMTRRRRDLSDAGVCEGVGYVCVNDPGAYHCECDSGFTTSYSPEGDLICEDIDECVLPSRCHCDANADCINVPGSCECQCHDGYDGDGLKCDNTDECQLEEVACDVDAACFDSYGGYDCVCHAGYVGDGQNCTNINECEEHLHNCNGNATCFDTPGAFFCRCDPGFQGHCDACVDVNECTTDTDNCDGNALCFNTPGSYYCQCKPGYLGDGWVCGDMDECILGVAGCDVNAECWNIPGGYECHCVAGYHLGVNGTCDDDNECTSSHHFCNRFAECENTQGSYACQCMEGYVGNGYSCLPEYPNQCGDKICDSRATCEQVANNENVCVCQNGYYGSGYIRDDGRLGCIEIDPCWDGPCDVNARCIALDGVPVCVCNIGYFGNGYSCLEVNPCSDSSSCGLGATCLWEGGLEYACLCPSGHGLIADYDCVDNNECESGSASCPSHSVCVNTQGSYTCACLYGFQWQDASGSCQDIDECLLGLDDCLDPDRTECENAVGGYTCVCKGGFTRNSNLCYETSEPGCDLVCPDFAYCKTSGEPEPRCACLTGFQEIPTGDGSLVCEDLNECSNSPCDVQATCQNTAPGYTCTCNAGYQGNGRYCEDIDECSFGLHQCDANAFCENIQANYTCLCDQGYDGNGYSCEPYPPGVDICGCGPNGACDSVRGRCDCKQGYYDDIGRTYDRCQDVDDCYLNNRCHPLAECLDLMGGYSCSCPPGYIGDGFSYCYEDKCLLGTAQCSPHADCNSMVDYHVCICKEGYTGNGTYCSPITDQCRESLDINCGMNAVCVPISGVPTCECAYGFSGDGENCQDINECLEKDPAFQHDCHDNGICINYPGGFICECRDGFEGNGRACEDIDECGQNADDCSQDAMCRNTVGSFSCICQPGFTGDGRMCLPAGNCTSDGSGCSSDAACVNSPTGYVCACNTGYLGDGHTCVDVDECAEGTDNCSPGATCSNSEGAFSCACRPGYSGDGYVCVEVNECLLPEDNDCEEKADCLNVAGSYRCVCRQGYSGDGLMCTDIDECSNSAWNFCAENATCTNTEGTYKCGCKDGFYGNGIACDDINECALGIANCTHNTLCYNTPGGFTCDCLQGYIDEDDSCTDVNECEDPALNECDENADCVDTEGGYDCECHTGFYGNGYTCSRPNPCDLPGVCLENSTCVNLGDLALECTCPEPMQGDGVTVCYPPNECVDGTNDCAPLAICIDTVEGYDCVCPDGSIGNGTECTDIDECDPDSPEGGVNACDSANGQECVNLPPDKKYTCTCDPTYLQDGDTCSKPNSCAENDCSGDADCINRNEGFTCSCHSGYEGDGQTCVDIDECTLETFFCEPGTKCSNTEGGYECVCDDGFLLNTDTDNCEDINECLGGDNSCSEDAYCLNLWGDYGCECLPGFQGDGHTCTDIDECTDELDPCHEHALCTNTYGSCICTCENGFTGDGVVCHETDQCPSEAQVHCGDGAYCVGLDSHGENYVCDCQSGYKEEGYPVCSGGVCTRVCTDKNECAFQTPVCDESAACQNSNGSYVCTCLPGFQGNGKYCEDVNECALVEDDCHPQYGECHNVVGSYECVCREGWVGDGRDCIQENECSSGRDLCDVNAECQDLVGSYRCTCKDGYQGDGMTCTDINECALYQDQCHELAECINQAGSYQCLCLDGYMGDGRTCYDVNECYFGTDNCYLQHAECVNIPGSFFCRCRPGQVLVEGMCQDINECVEEGKDAECADKMAVCVNMAGGYECVCPLGYAFNASGVCQDVNECQAGGVGVCGEGGTCQNTEGSCICGCQPGYHTREGTTCGPCIDIDECTNWRFPNQCPPHEQCHNLPGSYQCLCASGFKGQPPNCQDVDECQVAADAGQTLCAVGTCIDTLGDYICECPPGYRFGDGTCYNINECAEPSVSSYAGQCINSLCVDTEGDYTCVCMVGYDHVSERECEDIDECATPGLCQPHGVCANLPGTYTCVCEYGYQQQGQTCQDVNECTAYPGICGDVMSAICTNSEGSYNCSCRPGYRWINHICQDIDECAETSGLCGDTFCINLQGGYTCQCPDGFHDVNDLCQNINECALGRDNCDINADCFDSEGSYACACREGFTGNGRICQHICQPDMCPLKQACVVADGRPTCVCRCEGPDCLNEGVVCGTDGQTYLSDRELVMHACRTGQNITRNYRGPCQPTCASLVCPVHKECHVIDNVPTCTCPPCTNFDTDSGVICTERGDTYPNLCVFKLMQCAFEFNDVFAYFGPCETPRDCTYTQWSEWSDCSVNCDQGTRTRSRAIKDAPMFGGNNCSQPLGQVDNCYMGTCPGDPCESFQCRRPAEYCVVDPSSGLPRCQCPNCQYEPIDQICGTIGKLAGNQTRVVTAPNLCTLQYHACVSNQPYTVLHPGPCVEGAPNEPVWCTMVPHIWRVTTDDGCRSKEELRTNRCDGGCGQQTGHCCDPVDYQYSNQQFTCDNGQVVTKKVIYIEECGCVKGERGQAPPFVKDD